MTRIDAKRITLLLLRETAPFRIATDGTRYWVLYRAANGSTSYVYNSATFEKLLFSSHAEATQHIRRFLNFKDHAEVERHFSRNQSFE